MKLYPKRKGDIVPQTPDASSIFTQMLKNGSVDTLKIKDLAVTTAKITNLAVTDAKIETLTVSKLTTGNLTATGTITTGKLVTGAAGSDRIEITSSKIAGYNSSDVLQFYLDASNGVAYAGAGSVVLDQNGIELHGDMLEMYDASNIVGGFYAGSNDLNLLALRAASNLLIYNSSATGGTSIAAGQVPSAPADGTLYLQAAVAVKVDPNDSFIIPVL